MAYARLAMRMFSFFHCLIQRKMSPVNNGSEWKIEKFSGPPNYSVRSLHEVHDTLQTDMEHTFFLVLLRVLKFVTTFVLLTFLLACIFETRSSMSHADAQNINKKLENLTNSKPPALPKIKVWFNFKTNSYEMVGNAAHHPKAAMSLMQPKVLHYSMKVQFSEQFRWELPLFKIMDPGILMANTKDRILVVTDSTLILKIMFVKRIKIRFFLLGLSDDPTGRPTHFSIKIDEEWIEYLIPQKGNVLEFNSLDLGLKEVSYVVCKISNLDASTEFITLKRLGAYQVIDQL